MRLEPPGSNPLGLSPYKYRILYFMYFIFFLPGKKIICLTTKAPNRRQTIKIKTENYRLLLLIYQFMNSIDNNQIARLLKFCYFINKND